MQTPRPFVGHDKNGLSCAFSFDNPEILSPSRDKPLKGGGGKGGGGVVVVPEEDVDQQTGALATDANDDANSNRITVFKFSSDGTIKNLLLQLSSKCVTDLLSAEYCIIVLEAMLPIILSHSSLIDEEPTIPINTAARSKLLNMLNEYGSLMGVVKGGRACKSPKNIAKVILNAVKSTSRRRSISEGAYTWRMQSHAK